MACKCVEKVNKELEKEGLKLDLVFNATLDQVYPFLMYATNEHFREKGQKKKKKILIPTYCVFCGKKYKAELDWQKVKSSNVAAIAFDKEAGNIHIEFKNGTEYKYKECKQRDWTGLMKAKSVGAHLNKYIKGTFKHEKVPKGQGE